MAALGLPNEDEALWVGFAQRSLTDTEDGIEIDAEPMGGYWGRERRSEPGRGDDDLTARALAFRNNEKDVAIVALDLVGLSEAFAAEVREAVVGNMERVNRPSGLSLLVGTPCYRYFKRTATHANPNPAERRAGRSATSATSSCTARTRTRAPRRTTAWWASATRRLAT